MFVEGDEGEVSAAAEEPIIRIGFDSAGIFRLRWSHHRRRGRQQAAAGQSDRDLPCSSMHSPIEPRRLPVGKKLCRRKAKNEHENRFGCDMTMAKHFPTGSRRGSIGLCIDEHGKIPIRLPGCSLLSTASPMMRPAQPKKMPAESKPMRIYWFLGGR